MKKNNLHLFEKKISKKKWRMKLNITQNVIYIRITHFA